MLQFTVGSVGHADGLQNNVALQVAGQNAQNVSSNGLDICMPLCNEAGVLCPLEGMCVPQRMQDTLQVVSSRHDARKTRL